MSRVVLMSFPDPQDSTGGLTESLGMRLFVYAAMFIVLVQFSMLGASLVHEGCIIH